MAKQLHYFKFTAFYHWILAGAGMSLTGVLSLSPELVPYSSLGPVGTFLHYIAYDQATLIQWIFILAVGAHVVEGTLAFVMCRRMNLTSRDTLLWTLQTTILGVSSFIPLRARYKKMLKSQ